MLVAAILVKNDSYGEEMLAIRTDPGGQVSQK
jgi:hypothetical protein